MASLLDSGTQRQGTIAPVIKLVNENKDLQGYTKGTPSSLTRVILLTLLVCYRIAGKIKGIVFGAKTKISDVITQMENLKENGGTRFVNIVCRLAYLQLKNKSITKQEFAGEMARIGFTGWAEDLSINGIVGVVVDGAPGVGKTDYLGYRFADPLIQHFLAAVYLSKQPLVVASDFFTTELLALNKSCWCVLEFYCGLIELDGSDDARIALPHILKCLLKSVNGTKLIHNSPIVNLVLGCLFEAQNADLCQSVHHDHLTIGTFCIPIEVVQHNMEIFTYYVANSTKSSWTLYCRNDDFLIKFKKMMLVTYKKSVLTRTNANFITAGDMILTCKPHDEVNNIMLSTASLSPLVVTDSAYPLPATESVPQYAGGGIVPHDPTGTYGYMSIAAYESRHQVLHEKNYDMLRDILKNRFQELCQSTYVEGQYRKRDHLWFSVSRDLRHNLYLSVQISPLVPLHWVKVKQPNGSPELEEQIRQHAERSDQAASDIAELVMLNSHQPHLIEFNYPHFDKPVTIALDSHSESTDQGVIGCDCFMDKYLATEPVLARGVRQFDIKVDSCVPRELPLPKKRDQPINKEEPIAESGPAARQEPRYTL